MLFILKYIKRRLKKYKNKVNLTLSILLATLIISMFFIIKQNFNENNSYSSTTTLNTNYQLKRVPRYKSLNPPNNYKCVNPKPATLDLNSHHKNISNNSNKEILILSANSNVNLLTNLTKIFSLLRINLKKASYLNLNLITNDLKLIIFENYQLYLNVINEQIYIDHLVKYKIGLVIFNNNSNSSEKLSLEGCRLNINKFTRNKFFYLTKLNKQLINFHQILRYNSEFNRLFFNSAYNSKSILKCNDDFRDIFVDLIFVNNFYDIKHVFFTVNDLNFIWILKLLFLDSIRYVTDKEIDFDLKRFIQIDIDDVFVGLTGTRMVANDVDELIKLQNLFRNNYFNQDDYKFKFNLGYSGFYYQTGDLDENKADELFLKYKDEFNWFDHTWAHLKPHLLNESFLGAQFIENIKFAQSNKIPLDSFYSVSPHHSGIYPIYTSLYKAWSDLLSIKATSTEVYPHQNPIHLRRGFIFNNIMVAPRQSCGVYTHTLYFDAYRGGVERLISLYEGGQLFDTILYNQVNIFMTHMVNYGNDRLAMYLFENVFEFFSCWTNLKFIALSPLDIVKKYFELNPQDREPIWTDVCSDQRHLSIWHRNSTECKRLPKIIIIGPQKTGTTALHEFLKIHPELRTNKKTQHFEETQFFTDNNYFKGIDWYIDLFDVPINGSFINFEKSANYFDDPNVPKRIRSLIKNVKLVAFLMNPIDRAYSWYQHMKAHNDEIAVKYSFYEILISNATDLLKSKLRERCLMPGIYYKHLKVWLKEFHPQQLFLIDSDLFKNKPYVYLNKLQEYFRLNQFIDYKDKLFFDEKKSFYCLLQTNSTRKSKHKCLGASKGRKYLPIDKLSFNYLKHFYKEPNKKLKFLLQKYSFKLPDWMHSANRSNSNEI